MMQALVSYADGALFSEVQWRSRELARGTAGAAHGRDCYGPRPNLLDWPRLSSRLARAPWLVPPSSRDRAEDFRRRLADVVAMYQQGLGTVAALRLATRIALPISDRTAPPGLRTRPFTVEEYAPLRERAQAVQARGQPVDMVGPLMRWAVDSGSQKPVLSAAFVCGVEPVPGGVDATHQPVLERVHLTDNTGTGLAYDGDLAPGQALALWPAYRSWLGAGAGLDVAASSSDSATVANPIVPGPWAAAAGAPGGVVVAFFQSADQFLWTAVNQGGVGSLWRTDGTTWDRILDGLPELRWFAGRDEDLLIGLASGVTRLALYTPGAAPSPDPATLTGPEVHALAPDAAGRWWAAASTGAAQLGDDLSLTPIGPGTRPETETPFYAVFVDTDGTVMFGGDLGVFQFQAVQALLVPLRRGRGRSSPDWLPFDPDTDPLPSTDTVFLPAVRCLTRGPDTALWLGTEKGVTPSRP